MASAYQLVQNFFTRLSIFLFWRKPQHTLTALTNFQATEDDGTWHLEQVFCMTDQPDIKIEILYHMAEEQKHAEIFANLYKQIAKTPFKPRQYDRKNLYTPQEFWKNFVFVYVGEIDATDKFETIARQLKEGPVYEALSTIVEDEKGHPHIVTDVLKKLNISEEQIKKEIFKIRAQRAFESWNRKGKLVIDKIITILLYALFFLVGPFFYFQARSRMKKHMTPHSSTSIKRL